MPGTSSPNSLKATMKANGGTLVIDDVGRQRVDPHDLLNRWIIPLEGHIDYLTLHTGKKIAAPFENVLVFATNLEPEKIVREESEKTPMARKVHASFTKFQALVGPWDHVAEGAYHQFVAV